MKDKKLKFTFQFENEDDQKSFSDWWNDYGYYDCVEAFQNKGLEIMFQSSFVDSTNDIEHVTIMGAEDGFE
jgi:hypothetical protein